MWYAPELKERSYTINSLAARQRITSALLYQHWQDKVIRNDEPIINLPCTIYKIPIQGLILKLQYR